jgi:hypothetical protein
MGIRGDPGQNGFSASPCMSEEATNWAPVRIRVRICSQPPLACRKKQLNGVVLLRRSEKQRHRITAGMAR